MRHYRPLSGSLQTGTGGGVVRFNIPPLARTMRINADKVVYWRLDGADPRDVTGFAAPAGVSEIKVGGRSQIRFVGAATYNVYGQFFGGDSSSPADVRAKGPHTANNVRTTAVTIASHTATDAGNLARRNATEILCRASQAWRYTVDGSAPTATHGIYVPASAQVVVPIYNGTFRVIRASSNAQLITQAYENWHRLTHNPLIPVHTVGDVVGHVSQALPVAVHVVDVPKHATHAKISATGKGLVYSLNESNPTGKGGLAVAENATVDTAVTPGGTVRFLRAADGAVANIAFFSE